MFTRSIRRSRFLMILCLLLTSGSVAFSSNSEENSSPSPKELLAKWIKECVYARSVIASKAVIQETYSERFAKAQERLFKTKNLVGIDSTYFLHAAGKKLVSCRALRFDPKPDVPTEGTRIRSAIIQNDDQVSFLNSYSFEGNDFRIEHTMSEKKPLSTGILDVFAYIPAWSVALKASSIDDVYAISKETRAPGKVEFRVDVKNTSIDEFGPMFGMPAKPKSFSVVFTAETDWRPVRYVIESEQKFNVIVDYASYKQISTGATLPHICTASMTDERELWPQNMDLIHRMSTFELTEFREASISEIEKASDPFSYMGATPIASRPDNSNWLWIVLGVGSLVMLIMVVAIRIKSK